MAHRRPDEALAAIDAGQRDLLGTAPPAFLAPMAATLIDSPFSDDAWIYERKLDGVRVLAVRDGGDPVLWSRNHKRMDAAYPEVVEALAAHGPDRFVADGEIVAFDGATTSFARLQGRIHLTDPERARRTGIAVFCYLFDLPNLEGTDLRELPLRTRKRVLRDTFTFADPLRLSTHRNGDGEAYLEQACAKGWEGLIAKRADGPYVSTRSRDWLKLKCSRRQELVVGGFTDPQGSRVGFGALLVGYHDARGLRYAGKVGTGYDTATLRSLRGRLDELATDEPPFTDRVRERTAHWVRPELVAEVGFTEWTADGRLRHPRYLGLRTDKAAVDVVRESPAT